MIGMMPLSSFAFTDWQAHSEEELLQYQVMCQWTLAAIKCEIQQRRCHPEEDSGTNDLTVESFKRALKILNWSGDWDTDHHLHRRLGEALRDGPPSALDWGRDTRYLAFYWLVNSTINLAMIVAITRIYPRRVIEHAAPEHLITFARALYKENISLPVDILNAIQTEKFHDYSPRPLLTAFETLSNDGSVTDSIFLPDQYLLHEKPLREEPSAVHLFHLLLLLSNSDGFIQQDLIESLSGVRSRWAPNGELQRFTLSDTRIAQWIPGLFDKSILPSLLDQLRAHELISKSVHYGLKILNKGILMHQLMRDMPQSYWDLYVEQVILLACFWFSGSSYTSRFAELGCIALPYFQHVQQCFIDQARFASSDPEAKATIIEALIVSSRFPPTTWKAKVLDLLNSFGTQGLNSLCLARQVERRSILLRHMGDTAESECIISRYFIDFEDNAPDALLDGVRGKIALSEAWIHFGRGNFDVAAQKLPLMRGKSLYETYVARKSHALSAMIQLHKGFLNDAIGEYYKVLGLYDKDHSERLVVVSYLADAYYKSTQASKALNMIKHQVPDLNTTRVSSRCARFILVSYIESLFDVEGETSELLTILHHLKDYFGSQVRLEEPDQQRHIRTLVLNAKMQHASAASLLEWAETAQSWANVEELIKKYHVMAENSADAIRVKLSKAHALWNLGVCGWAQSDKECWLDSLDTDWISSFSWKTVK